MWKEVKVLLSILAQNIHKVQPLEGNYAYIIDKQIDMRFVLEFS